MSAPVNPTDRVSIEMGDETIVTTWSEFLADNADYLDATEAARIAADLSKRPGCTAFFGGGGAAGDFSIRLLIGDSP